VSDFCERCCLPRFMCPHREPGPATAGPDWDNVEALALASLEADTGPAVEARFDRRCPGCGEHVAAGEPVTFSRTEDRFVCLACAAG
jgi:hypothetical protein